MGPESANLVKRQVGRGVKGVIDPDHAIVMRRRQQSTGGTQRRGSIEISASLPMRKVVRP